MRRLAPLALLLIGCGASSDLLANRTGRAVTVYIRPDALGVSANLPASVEADIINGASVSISGNLVSSDERWVTVEKSDGTESLIARDAVLSVAVRKGAFVGEGVATPSR